MQEDDLLGSRSMCLKYFWGLLDQTRVAIIFLRGEWLKE